MYIDYAIRRCTSASAYLYLSQSEAHHNDTRSRTGPPMKGAPMMPPGIIIMPGLNAMAGLVP